MLNLFLNNNALFAVAEVSAVIGLVSAAVGTPVALRHSSQATRAASHAALPALTLFFLALPAGGQKLSLIACGICAFAVFLYLTRNSFSGVSDAHVQLSVCVYMGLGLAMLTLVNHHPLAARAGLDKFLLGEASTIITEDLGATIFIGLVILSVLLLFWKNFILVGFDYDFAKATGLHPRFLDAILSALVAACLALSLTVAGALFAAALLVLPALAARQWTNRIWLITLFAMFLGALCALAGAVLSALFPRVPSGAAIALALVAVTAFSLFLGPANGLFWRVLFKD